jgi:carboxypeptidase Taq
MSRTGEAIAELKKLDEKVTRLGHIAALLEWDQETYLPPDAVEERASQIALIVGLHHEGIVDDDWAALFTKLGYGGGDLPSGLDETDSAFLRETLKRWSKKTRVPRELVEDLARATSISQNAWAGARKSDDFSAFAPHLERVIQLKQEYAKAVSPDGNAYDVLLDEYEPDAKGAEIEVVFDGLADGLNLLMKKIRSGSVPDTAFLEKPFSIDLQNDFGRKIQSYMGYDYRRGRLDLSTHPFTTTLGPDDVRVTTRYDRNQVLSGLLSNIHEAGHGLYEQGMGANLKGTMLADGTSLGIHESQSRFWENTIGRSMAFWDLWYPQFQGMFLENLEGVSARDFYRAVNLVKPSLIRVEADEVTYSFHIIIRFRLEKALISGELQVKDLPDAWRNAYREHLGIVPPSDELGCLQDVHWSVGLFGYFPTYALGNLYAAQFTRTMENQLGPAAQLIREGHTDQILNWLRQNIHRHGRVFPPGELCRRVTGESLNPGYFLEYLNRKYAEVYRF